MEVLLIGLDGSIASYINIDTLQFQEGAFEVDILQDYLAFEQSGDTQVSIFYQNDGLPNRALAIAITRMDTDEEVYTNSVFTDNNRFNIFFDYTTLSNVNESTLFRLDLTRTNSEGTETITRYFSPKASVGFLSAGIAMTISAFLIFFGLTFSISRLAFSWFGIAAVVASLFVLSMAVSTWYTTLMFAINIVTLVYIVIVMVNQNQGTLAG